MGGVPLRGPIVAMLASHRGNGYLLFARDGGVFAFSDAVFRGSLARAPVEPADRRRRHQPRRQRLLVGRAARRWACSPSVDCRSRGACPPVASHVRDVVGLASTPTGRGYWMARSDGRVAAFGDAVKFGGVRPSACDPIAAIVANPDQQGYRLVTDSGRTIPRGDAPGGPDPTGVPRVCGHVRARIELPASTVASGGVLTRIPHRRRTRRTRRCGWPKGTAAGQNGPSPSAPT